MRTEDEQNPGSSITAFEVGLHLRQRICARLGLPVGSWSHLSALAPKSVDLFLGFQLTKTGFEARSLVVYLVVPVGHCIYSYHESDVQPSSF